MLNLLSKNLSLSKPNDKKKNKVKYVCNDSDTNEENVEQLEALLTRIFHRGRGKFKGKFPTMCFNCNEVGHIAYRFLEKNNNRSGNIYRCKRDEDKKYYKGKKSCYIIEEETKDGFDDHDDKVVYVAMKDDSDENEATALESSVNKNEKWMTDNGCSHHITRDKSKFITLNYYDINSVRFGNDTPYFIKGKGSSKLTK